jgi:D-xylose transport system substrate-binding protein
MAYDVNSSVDNGKGQVAAYLLDPVPVDMHNLRETVIKDGFHQEQDVFGPPKATDTTGVTP